MTSTRRLTPLVLALACVTLAADACGKKGPPLPPLVLLPAPPGDFSAVRRGGRVDLRFQVPGANTDRSTPADLTHVEVYALTAPEPAGAADVVRLGTRIASLVVQAPPDPDAPPADRDAPPRPGLGQQATAEVAETLPAGASPQSYRTYVAVGINARGRRGALSPRIAVPLVPPPPAPAQPTVEYDETSVTVSWAAPETAPDAGDLQYRVYTAGSDAAALTAEPIGERQFVDKTVTWDSERCFAVRAVETVEEVRIESEPSPATCITPRDTFAPAAPQGLVGVGSEGAISLIWTPSGEPDLAGYLVLRAIEPATELTPVTPAPITDTNYRDTVPSGSRVTYAVQAVDKAGNRSEPSARITESAR